jgi:prepilin-type N-terminal cleavage/methylation domain-containing protein/prepilin-type processing-associated H-X9-DG protein
MTVISFRARSCRVFCQRLRAFSLIELLMVLAIVAVIIGLLVPALSSGKRSAIAARCLANMRSLEQAHWAYALDNKGLFIDAGMPHGGLGNEEVSWLNTLQEHYGNTLVLRSPADLSPHWPADVPGGGTPVPGTIDRFRRTSYGINNYLSRTYSPAAAVDPSDAADRLSKVSDPANTVHFLIMAFHGNYAGCDHVHVEGWWGPNLQTGSDFPAVHASSECETNAHGGPEKSFASRANWGFLDGHVETATFGEVYIDRDNLNRFDPDVSKFFATRHASSQQ